MTDPVLDRLDAVERRLGTRPETDLPPGVTRSPPPPLTYRHPKEALLSILWIILIIIVVLALLGFFSRGVW